ncbi:glycosyltransferase family 4 protein [Nonomuraea typhae]|uniref:glycosyltransferase family 4 protein n=1 Tax=Nonomuraea typhae TaxID=2603600 RepID=UPI001FECF855|nr:glycosyltransferase family 4 protein [Nonomuraea typhae]
MSDCYLPRLGGIEVQVADLVRQQREAGHEVEVATATRGEPLDGVHRIVARMPFDLPVHPRGVGHITRLLTTSRPAVVHVHTGAVSPFAWMGVRAAVRAGLPVVVTVHSMWDPGTRAVYRLLRLVYEWHRWGVVATTVSNAAAVAIRRVAGRGVPVHVVSNGLDLSGWRPVGVGAPPAEPGAHIVAVGRLAPRKHPVRLLRALHAARSKVPPSVPMRATIVGDGPARASMERYLAKNGMTGWVTLPGRQSREEIAKLLAAADLFVAPAPLESFGIAALEARAAGLPVIARERSGVADFVRHGEEGLLARNEADLARCIARLTTDTALRTAMATHNRSTEPTAGSWKAVLEGFDHAYTQAIG